MKFFKMNFALVRDNENELLNKIRSANDEENSIWKISNIIFPVATIVLAIICNFAFSKNRGVFYSYVNLIVNGSLPLIAINQISALGLHIFKFDTSQEKKLGIEETSSLRVKLLMYSIGIIVFGVILFVHQAINNPFSDMAEPSIAFVLSLWLVFLSSKVARNTFLLQGDFIAKTFADKINDNLQKHSAGWNNI